MELAAQVRQAVSIDPVPFLHDAVELGEAHVGGGEVRSPLAASFIIMQRVPHAVTTMIEENGRRNGGLVDVLRYVRIMLPLAGSPHRILLSYCPSSAACPPA